jgi:hypothetical protein
MFALREAIERRRARAVGAGIVSHRGEGAREVPGRCGRLHASLPLRRNAGPSWPLTESPTMRAYRRTPLSPPRRPAAAVRPSPDRPEPRERPGAARAPRHTRTTPRPPVRRESERHASQRIRIGGRRPRPNAPGPPRTRDPTRALPDPLLPSFPAFASLPRSSTSAVLIASVVPSSSSSLLLSVPSRLPPPRLRPSTLHAWAALPGVCLQVEEGGSSAKRWTPRPRKPRRTSKPRPEAGRRPIDLQASTPRNQHPEVNPSPWMYVRARAAWALEREWDGMRAQLRHNPERALVPALAPGTQLLRPGS